MGFGYNMQLNLQHGKEELDNGDKSTIRHAAPFFGRAALTYRHDKLTMELYTQFQAKRSYEDMPDSEKSKTELYALDGDRKSTRLNSRHANISYAVFCLKKNILARRV